MLSGILEEEDGTEEGASDHRASLIRDKVDVSRHSIQIKSDEERSEEDAYNN